MRGPQANQQVSHRQNLGPTNNQFNSNAQDRGVRGAPRDRSRSISKAGIPQANANRKYSQNLGDEEEVGNNPPISSADLDQLMEDFDLNDPMEDYGPKPTPVTTAKTSAATTPHTESKLGGITGGLGAGLSSGLSGLSNPMGKLGEMATQNPVTGAMSKGKDFLFKKFGL